MSTTKTDTQLSKVPAPLESEKPTTEVYWPCAPDGYIPNSVVRSLIKPRRPPPMLIPRRKRRELKQEETKEEEGDDEFQDKKRIKGSYIFNISFPYYFIGVKTVCGGSRPWTRGGEGIVLLALSAFLPSVISSFFIQNKGWEEWVPWAELFVGMETIWFWIISLHMFEPHEGFWLLLFFQLLSNWVCQFVTK